MKAALITDYRALAKRRLPHFLFEHIHGGSYEEVSLRRNVADLERVALRQRVLRDVSSIDTSTRLFGQSLSMPVILAPIGLAGLNARRGERQDSRAAATAGVPFCLSTLSVCPLAEVASAAAQPLWLQLYMTRDRSFMVSLTEAQRLGCNALVCTVDMPVPGSRYRDYRSGLAGAPGVLGAMRRAAQALLKPRWTWDVGIHGRPQRLGQCRSRPGTKFGSRGFLRLDARKLRSHGDLE